MEDFGGRGIFHVLQQLEGLRDVMIRSHEPNVDELKAALVDAGILDLNRSFSIQVRNVWYNFREAAVAFGGFPAVVYTWVWACRKGSTEWTTVKTERTFEEESD